MTVLHLPASRALRLAAIGLAAATGLAACGGSSGSPATVTPSGAAATGTPGAAGRGFNSAEFQKIQECLTAAGISLPTRTGGFPTGRPTDRPSGSPSARFTGPRPSGSGRVGGFGGEFSDPTVRAALQACGIALPTRPAGAGGLSGGPAPTATN